LVTLEAPLGVEVTVAVEVPVALIVAVAGLATGPLIWYNGISEITQLEFFAKITRLNVNIIN
jgi:hypothetical protein